MPQFRQHLAINVTVIAVVDTFCQLREMSTDPNQRFDCARLLAGVSAGAVAGALPDLLEPSLGNPNHRGFCHSLCAAGLAWWLVAGRHSEAWSPGFRRIMRLMALGYASHITADLFLSKGKGMGIFNADC